MYSFSLFHKALPGQTGSAGPGLPTFSGAFSESNFVWPTADIIVDGIEAGVAVAAGVNRDRDSNCCADPEFWWISIPAYELNVPTVWDAHGRLKTGIQRLNER